MKKTFRKLCLILIVVSTGQSVFCPLRTESASSPLPQKIAGPQLQRDDCVVPRNTGTEDFDSYIEEFLFSDTRAGLSLYSCINWAEGFLMSEGLGKNASRRTAELVARGNALKTLLMVNLSSEVNLQRYFERQGKIRLSSQNVLIRKAEIQERAPSNDFARVVVRIPFYGISGLSSFLLDDKELFLTPPRAVQDSSDELYEPLDEDFTSIVIDVRNLSDVEPALLPKILSEDGAVLYDVSPVDKEILQEQGMIEYVREIPDQTSRRVGERPLFIKPLLLASASDAALRFPLLAQQQAPRRRSRGNNLIVEGSGSQGEIPANVVVSVEDAKKIKQLNQDKQFNKQGKYTILIGGEIGGVKGQSLDSLHAFRTD